MDNIWSFLSQWLLEAANKNRIPNLASMLSSPAVRRCWKLFLPTSFLSGVCNCPGCRAAQRRRPKGTRTVAATFNFYDTNYALLLLTTAIINIIVEQHVIVHTLLLFCLPGLLKIAKNHALTIYSTKGPLDCAWKVKLNFNGAGSPKSILLVMAILWS